MELVDVRWSGSPDEIFQDLSKIYATPSRDALYGVRPIPIIAWRDPAKRDAFMWASHDGPATRLGGGAHTGQHAARTGRATTRSPIAAHIRESGNTRPDPFRKTLEHGEEPPRETTRLEVRFIPNGPQGWKMQFNKPTVHRESGDSPAHSPVLTDLPKACGDQRLGEHVGRVRRSSRALARDAADFSIERPSFLNLESLGEALVFV